MDTRAHGGKGSGGGDGTGATWLAAAARLPPALPVIAALGFVLVSGLLLTWLPMPEHFEPVSSSRRYPVFFATLIAFYVACVPAFVRDALATTRAVEGIAAERLAAFRAEPCRLPGRWVAGGVDALCAVHLAIVVALDIDWVSYLDADVMLSPLGISRVLGWLHAVLGGLAAAALLRHCLLFQHLAVSLREVDLLDHRALAPFVRASFRATLMHFTWAGVTAAFHVRWAGTWALEPQALAFLPVQTLFGVALFLLPLWGAHRRLRAERDAELSRVRGAIRGDRAALRDSLLGAGADALGPLELLEYRERVRSLSTRPFEVGALARLALLTAIPVAGWIGGAQVERALDALLD